MKFDQWQATMFMKRNVEGFSRMAQVSFFMDPSLINITLKLQGNMTWDYEGGYRWCYKGQIESERGWYVNIIQVTARSNVPDGLVLGNLFLLSL